MIPNLERRFRETESGAVREELAKFLSSQHCPDCKGTRLNRAARHVFVADRSLPEISSMSVGHAVAFFDSLALEGWRAADHVAVTVREPAQVWLGEGADLAAGVVLDATAGPIVLGRGVRVLVRRSVRTAPT